MIPTIHLTRGLPASGKSTLGRQLAAATGAVHVQLDAHRRRVWPECPRSWDPYSGRGLAVSVAWEAEILGHVLDGRHVVSDRTHLDGRAARRLEELLGNRARFVIHDLTHVGVDECLRRDATRPVHERVGESGIRALHDRWLA